jgi:hypothetical protein
MHLNKLRDIKRIRGEHFTFSSISGEESDDDDSSEESKEVGAFEIDSKIKNGRLALIYKSGKTVKPQIWF